MVVLTVICPTSELDEFGEVIRVGDDVHRLAARRRGAYFGTRLDEVEWYFDQYAGLSEREAATIHGSVASIEAVYVHLTRAEGGWTAILGSAHTEPLESTEATRRIQPRVALNEKSHPDEAGLSYQGGYPVREEGEESLVGWAVVLERDRVLSAGHVAGSGTPA